MHQMITNLLKGKHLMSSLPQPSVRTLACSVIALLFSVARSDAEDSPADPATNDYWVEQRDEQTGILVRTKELILYPAAESKPALKHRLLLDPFERTRGNAANTLRWIFGRNHTATQSQTERCE